MKSLLLILFLQFNFFFICGIGYSQEFEMPSFVHAIDACDMDMDGSNDIIVSCGYIDTIAILFNDGYGNFNPQYYGSVTGHLLCGCIDGDSIPDIVTTTNNLNYIKNNGDQTLYDSLVVLLEDINFPMKGVIDMNHDGWNDLFYQTNAYSQMGVMQNHGNLIFTNHIIYSGFSSAPDLGDLNTDHLPDIVVSFPDPISETNIFVNNDDFNFDISTVLDLVIQDPVIMESNNSEPEDLVLLETPSANVYFYENRGNGNFEYRGNTPLINVYAVVLADHNDYNNDGYGDISYCQCPITGCNDSVYIALNSQNWSFSEGQAYYIGTLNWFRIKSIDLNGDDFPDLYMTGYNSNKNIKILWNNGDGTFSNINPVGIQENISKGCSINIYPNPATDNFVVEYTSDKSGMINISLVSNTGLILSNLKDGMTEKGEYNEIIKMPALSAGLYFITIGFDGMISDTRKLIIAR